MHPTASTGAGGQKSGPRKTRPWQEWLPAPALTPFPWQCNWDTLASGHNEHSWSLTYHIHFTSGNGRKPHLLPCSVENLGVRPTWILIKTANGSPGANPSELAASLGSGIVSKMASMTPFNITLPCGVRGKNTSVLQLPFGLACNTVPLKQVAGESKVENPKFVPGSNFAHAVYVGMLSPRLFPVQLKTTLWIQLMYSDYQPTEKLIQEEASVLRELGRFRHYLPGAAIPAYCIM